MATDSALKENTQPPANPFSSAYVRREGGDGVGAGFAVAGLGGSSGHAHDVSPRLELGQDAGSEPGRGPEDGYEAGKGTGPVPYPAHGIPPLVAARFQGIELAEREWWRHQYRRLQFRANLSLALAGIALTGLLLLLSANQFSSESVGNSSPLADYTFGAGMPGGTAPVSAGSAEGMGGTGLSMTRPFLGAFNAGQQVDGVPSDDNHTARATGGEKVGEVRQSELEVQLLRLTSRVMALEEEQHAIDQALARLRYDRLEKATGALKEAE